MRIRYQYFVYGMLFGLMFPLGAAGFELVSHSFSLSLENIARIHAHNRLLFMIDSAPVFLGIFALLGGISMEKSKNLLSRFREISKALIACNNQLNENSRIIFDVMEKARKLFASLSAEIKNLHAEGEEFIYKNQDTTNRLETESGSIMADATHLLTHSSLVKTSSDEITAELEQFLPKIRELSQKLAYITSIGSEINILAINAGIEAHNQNIGGKSFRVIAIEIKTLSDKINNMNKDMQKLIAESEWHISQLSEKTTANESLYHNMDELSGNIQWQITQYREVLQLVIANLTGTRNIFESLTEKYTDFMENLFNLNITQAEHIEGLRQTIQKEVELVDSLQAVANKFND